MSKPKEYASMTKDKLMTYTFGAFIVLAVISAVMWSQVTPVDTLTGQPLMNLGLTVAIVCLIAVGVAVGTDFFLYKVVSDSPLNTMSAAVFGLVVALSYSLGVPTMALDASAIGVTSAPGAFICVALISFVGLVLFKKIFRGRVNPAAAAKLIILLPFINSALLAKEHFASMEAGGLSMPLLAGPIGRQVIGNNGIVSFAEYLQYCYNLPTATTFADVNWIMILQKFHGWIGGASSIAVIIVGIALFVLARRFIKWRITVTYFASVALMALLMAVVYGGDMDLRILFSLFIGSSIFLGFFMATDPATTPLTQKGQLLFGVGVGVLTVLIQTYMNFFGGSILALVIMNLLAPQMDKIGLMKPTKEKKEPKLPKAKQFTSVKTYECIRCGACLRVCCHKLSPIYIKEAYDKMNVEKMSKLNADYCTGCGHCSFVCPSRIDLKGSVLRAKAMLRGEEIKEHETKGATIEAPRAEVRKVEVPKVKTEEAVIPEFKIIDSAHGHVIERIIPANAKKLNSLQIYTSSDLLEAGATPLARKELAEKTGISDSLILKYVNIADLLRIEGIGEKYANLLEVSGVDTVVELGRRIPENLHAKMKEINEKQHLVERQPTLAEVTKWVTEAKALARKIEY